MSWLAFVEAQKRVKQQSNRVLQDVKSRSAGCGVALCSAVALLCLCAGSLCRLSILSKVRNRPIQRVYAWPRFQ
jgi:hypothetical protein